MIKPIADSFYLKCALSVLHLPPTFFFRKRNKNVTQQDGFYQVKLVGNFGDGAIYRIKFNDDLSVKSNEVWAQDPNNLVSTDGMIMDGKGNLYIADFCANYMEW